MLVIISPAKTMDFSNKNAIKHTIPDLFAYSTILINILRKLSPKQICKLMDLSDKLGQLNFSRYQNFSNEFTTENALQAIFALKGEVYAGLKAETFAPADLEYSQTHLRILSGLYGCLKPLDLIQPYRLEMSTKLASKNGKNLYQFWGDVITEKLNESLQQNGDNILINLASNEYFKAIKPKLLQAKIITPIFKEKKGNNYKVIMLHAKHARGLMASYILKNRINNVTKIKEFNMENYQYSPEFSDEYQLVFTR